MTRLLTLILCLLLSSTPVPARAQVAEPAHPSVDPDLHRGVDAQIAALEQRERELDENGPRIGTYAGGIITAAGLITGGIVIAGCTGSTATGAPCSPEHAIGFGVGAGVATIVGLATFIPSYRKLRRQEREREEIGKQILDLRSKRAQATPTRMRIGVIPGSTPTVTIGWIY